MSAVSASRSNPAVNVSLYPLHSRVALARARPRLMNDTRPQWECAARGEVVSEAQYEAACVRDPTDALAAIDACGVVVGLYPDQATDALVNLALSTCVAPPLSSHRLALRS